MRHLMIAAMLGATLTTSAFAADADKTTPTPSIAPASITAAVSAATTSATPDPSAMAFRKPGRPLMLPALYIAAAGLQGYDAYSTLTVLKSGGNELNPMMKGVVTRPGTFIALKATVAAASIVAAETMWRDHHRVGAVVTMIVSNALMGAVAHHNTQVLNQLR